MKKNVIAVAVAAALVAPVAMADVSVSGTLQAEIVSVGGDGAAKDGIYLMDGMQGSSQNSGNAGRIDFKASEDLGDGMKAFAHYGLNVVTGTDRGTTTLTTAALDTVAVNNDSIGTREALVGLSAGWGTVMAGRMNQPYKTSTVGWDPMLATFMQARGYGGMNKDLHGSEVDNAVAYANTFGTAKVVAALVVDETAKAASDATVSNHAFAASVNAPVGPVEVAIAYFNADKTGMETGSSNKIATKVGVKWTSGDFTVAGQVEMLDKGFSAQGEKGNVMYLTGSYAMGNNTLSASYGQTDKKLNSVAADKATTYMAVALNHAFSKTTTAHVGYRSSDTGSNTKETAFGAGLRVKF